MILRGKVKLPKQMVLKEKEAKTITKKKTEISHEKIKNNDRMMSDIVLVAKTNGYAPVTAAALRRAPQSCCGIDRS